MRQRLDLRIFGILHTKLQGIRFGWWFFFRKAAEVMLALSSELHQFWGSREMGVPARVCLARHERAPPKENCQGLSLRGLGFRVQV